MLRVGLTHLAESNNISFPETDMIDNISQLDVLKICRCQKVLIENLIGYKALKLESLSRKLSKCLNSYHFLEPTVL